MNSRKWVLPFGTIRFRKAREARWKSDGKRWMREEFVKAVARPLGKKLHRRPTRIVLPVYVHFKTFQLMLDYTQDKYRYVVTQIMYRSPFIFRFVARRRRSKRG